MLKRNDLVIAIFLVLYLVSIYVEYMYMCVRMCIMNLTYMVVYMYFHVFLVIWDSPHTTGLIRNIDYIYNIFLFEVALKL